MRARIEYNPDRKTLILVIREIRQETPKHAIQIPLIDILEAQTIGGIAIEIPEVIEGQLIPTHGG